MSFDRASSLGHIPLMSQLSILSEVCRVLCQCCQTEFRFCTISVYCLLVIEHQYVGVHYYSTDPKWARHFSKDTAKFKSFQTGYFHSEYIKPKVCDGRMKAKLFPYLSAPEDVFKRNVLRSKLFSTTTENVAIFRHIFMWTNTN